MPVARQTEPVPFVSTAQMIEVDRAMIEDYGIDLMQMMENAGRNLAHLTRLRFLDGDPVGRRVIVLAGTGGNAGGAMVAARRLHNWGAAVQVVLGQPASRLVEVARRQFEILQRMGVPATSEGTALDREGPADVVLDGVIGYSLRGTPRGRAASLIRWANIQRAPVLSLDVPSGVHAGTGQIHDPAIQATATMTLALPKDGMLRPGVAAHVGELYLADISVPPSLYAAPLLDLEVGPLFAHDDIIQLAYP